MIVRQPLVAAARDGQFDVVVTVSGGGLSGQAGAVRHGLSKALTYYELALRGTLKSGGFLTRDSRVVERKNTVARKPVVASSSRNASLFTFSERKRGFSAPFLLLMTSLIMLIHGRKI